MNEIYQDNNGMLRNMEVLALGDPLTIFVTYPDIAGYPGETQSPSKSEWESMKKNAKLISA